MIPSDDEPEPEPVRYYGLEDAGPEYDHVSMRDLKPVLSDSDRKLARAEARRKAGKSSKKGPKKTVAERKAESEEKIAVKKREQEVYNLFWGISEPEA